jgi:hypothetical protein
MDKRLAGGVLTSIFTGILSLGLPVQTSFGEFHYSWSGTLVANGSNDPWNIGEDGASFTLNVQVPREAPDLFDMEAEFAAYRASNATFLLEGEEVPLVGPARTIEFLDNLGGNSDLIIFTGTFIRMGEAVEVGSGVTLPLATLGFRRLMETPPQWAR